MVVGDESSGKTDMLVQFCRGNIDSYSPSQFDSYNVPVTVDGVFIFLSIWDTAGTTIATDVYSQFSSVLLTQVADLGTAEYDSMRPIAYTGTHVFIICFSLYHEDSFKNVRDKVRQVSFRHKIEPQSRYEACNP